MKQKKIAVLLGGWSAEREVSLSSGESVVAALKELGHIVIPIDVNRDISELVSSLSVKPDLVFNALHGVGGEDGVVQGMLEVMGIPYTHSGVSASAIAMNKVLSRKVFEQEGLPVPQWRVVSRQTLYKEHPMELPYVIKPINEGSSKGVFIIHSESDLEGFNKEWCFGDTVLIEKYIPGRDIQVAVMGDKPLGAIEIRPYEQFYDYTAKYTPGKAEHLMPAPLPTKRYKDVLEMAQIAHQSLGCRGVTRSDFMYDESKDQFYLLELNTQPGMTPLSLVQEIAANQGISFNQLISWMVDQAQCDQ